MTHFTSPIRRACEAFATTRRRMAIARRRTAGRRFLAEDGGVAAVEFCIVALFLFPLIFGFVMIIDAEQVSTKVSKTNSTVGDLIARLDVVDQAALNGIFRAADVVIGPEHADKLDIYAIGVSMEQNANYDPSAPTDPEDENYDPEKVSKSQPVVSWIHANKPEICAALPKPGERFTAGTYTPEAFSSNNDFAQFFIYTRSKLSHEPILSGLANFYGDDEDAVDRDGPPGTTKTGYWKDGVEPQTYTYEYANLNLARDAVNADCIDCENTCQLPGS